MSDAGSFSNLWFQWQKAMLDESFAAVKAMSHLPMLWQHAQRIRKGVTPAEAVYEEDSLKLRHYLSQDKPQFKTPVVFVYALVNRPYILDLKKGRSVIEKFVASGFDTYLVDWGAPDYSDRHLTLDDYVNGYLRNVVQFLCERCDVEKVNIVGYCMGGTLSSMFAALHPERVQNLILMAAPIDFATSEGLLNVWAKPENFDVDKFVDAFGNCPPEFLQSIFLMLRPVDNLFQKPINFYEHIQDEKFLEDFLTTEIWLNDNIAVPGEVYREFVKYLYQKNLLVQNRLCVGKHVVNLQNITCPILNIIASEDNLVPSTQSQPFNDYVGSMDRRTLILKGSGHIGLAIGSRAQSEIWPQACAWLAERTKP